MKVKILGIGNAFTSIHNNTSFLVESDKIHLIDCPPNISKILSKIGLDKTIIADVIITHVHEDHIGGLESMILWKKYIQGKKLNIYTTKGIYKDLCDRLKLSVTKVFDHSLTKLKSAKVSDFINFVELKYDVVNKIGETKFEIRKNWHNVETFGLKIIHNNKTLAYSGDTRYDSKLIKELLKKRSITKKQAKDLLGFLWNADLILHDAESIEDGIHTSIKQLEKKSAKIRKNMLLIHVNDHFFSDKIKVAEQYVEYEI